MFVNKMNLNDTAKIAISCHNGVYQHYYDVPQTGITLADFTSADVTWAGVT